MFRYECAEDYWRDHPDHPDRPENRGRDTEGRLRSLSKKRAAVTCAGCLASSPWPKDHDWSSGCTEIPF